jgi:hypothetical protein
MGAVLEIHPIIGVQCGYLVGLGQGWVVEHGLYKLIEGSAQCDDGLDSGPFSGGAATNGNKVIMGSQVISPVFAF